MILTEDAPVTELVTPEIPTTLTAYDRIQKNRQNLHNVLNSGKVKQAFGAWQRDHKMCFLQTALSLV